MGRERPRARVQLEVSPRFRTVLVVVLGLLACFLIIGGTLAYNRYQDSKENDQAVKESQVQDYALCTIQNENRAATRQNSLIIFNLVTAVLLNGGPDDADTRKVFRNQLQDLTKQLKALKPIDCSTYVRPVPPDTGVDSPAGSG